MAATRSRENLALIKRLESEPFRFDFFQAVRVLERAAGSQQSGAQHGSPVGFDSSPMAEAVRFRASPTLGFPPCAIFDVKPSANGHAGAENVATHGPTEMIVSFIGLTGPTGVLPLHYTRLLIERIREKDYSLRDFFDLFNHRLISLFYRAWEKYRFPSGYERARTQSAVSRKPAQDLFTSSLFSLVGLGTQGLRGRLSVADEAMLFYGGYFADAHRSATSLERLVADYFNLPAAIDQFRGQWLNLSLDDCSCMPSAERPQGLNNQLGVSAVLGDRIWDVQSRFRVRLGPLMYQQYCRFIPSGDALQPICELVRTFAGPEFDFDVQPVLKAGELPNTRIGSVMDVKPRLGWNVWLKSREMPIDFAEAAFCVADS
jgi:type VI secretion system protein ImpH